MSDRTDEPSLRERVEPVVVLTMTMLFAAAIFWLMLPTAR